MTPLDELVDACADEDIARVQECMAACVAQHIDINDTTKDMPLMIACLRHDVEIVEYLIQCGADVLVPDEDGWTALHCAIHGIGADLDIIRLLLAHGADVMAVNHNDETVLRKTMQTKFNRELVEVLLDAGADAMAANKGEERGGDTLLHTACRHTNTDAAAFLLSRGVDVNARNELGMTPLCIAAMRGYNQNESLVELLLRHGADPDVVDHQGCSIVDRCIFYGVASAEVFQLLVNYGEDTS